MRWTRGWSDFTLICLIDGFSESHTHSLNASLAQWMSFLSNQLSSQVIQLLFMASCWLHFSNFFYSRRQVQWLFAVCCSFTDVMLCCWRFNKTLLRCCWVPTRIATRHATVQGWKWNKNYSTSIILQDWRIWPENLKKDYFSLKLFVIMFV